MKSVDEQLSLLKRGIDQLVPEDEMRKKLERSLSTGTPLRVKYGIDPTGIDVHLGHTVPLRKLRLFQELGHKAVLIIGNYTALVGDPSGRDESRVRLTQEQVEENAKDYIKQVSKVIDIEQTEVRYNGEWFSKFTFLDVLSLCGQITMQRMLERDDFTKRINKGTPIYLHECLYPLMQARDSVEIQADVELGGSEQLFSLMLARDLQKDAGQEPQISMTLPILRGLDGERRMGKSLGNYIGVGEKPYDQQARTMSIPDHLMREWFELLTSRSMDEILILTDTQKTHPRQAKEILGKDIVAFYHGQEAAEQAAAEFTKRFTEGEDPSSIPQRELSSDQLEEGAMQAPKLLVALGLATSGRDAWRLVSEGSLKIGPDRELVDNPKSSITVSEGLIVRVGKKKVVTVKLIEEPRTQ